jgi:hypothetical protein
MRKPKLPPDTRLDWRDPNMPVLAHLHGAGPLTPQQMQDRALKIMDDYDADPYYYADENWRNDPTYNMRVRK